MEKERHDDNLDRFLQKALGQFDATPGPGLWDRIESDLGPVGKAPGRGLYMQRGHIAIAAAVVLLLFAWQYCHFTRELEDIQTEFRNIAYQQPLLQEKVAAPAGGARAENAGDPDMLEPTEHISAAPVVKSTRLANRTLGFSSSEPAQILSSNGNGVSPSPVTPTLEKVVESEAVLVDLEVSKPHILNALDFIPSIKSRMVNRTHTVIPLIVDAGITSVHQNRGAFSIGVHSALATYYSKPVAEAPGHGSHSGEKYFSDADAEQGIVRVTGIVLEKALNKKWSIVSGADYLVYTIERTQRSKLKFSDKDPHGGGPHNDEHKFNYYVNTGSSTYTLDVDLRAIDASIIIDPEEELEFKLTTVQRSTAVSFPLAAQYRFQKGRWSVLLKGGIRMNAWLKNDGELSSFTCNNPLFEVRNEPNFRPDKVNKTNVTADALFAAGVEYKAGRLGFQITPLLNTPILKGVRSNSTTAAGFWSGVSAGAQYYF